MWITESRRISPSSFLSTWWPFPPSGKDNGGGPTDDFVPGLGFRSQLQAFKSSLFSSTSDELSDGEQDQAALEEAIVISEPRTVSIFHPIHIHSVFPQELGFTIRLLARFIYLTDAPEKVSMLLVEMVGVR
jgi:hypothetical protein